MGVLTDGKTKLNLTIDSEQESVKNTVAQHPVQRGDPMVDHTQRESKEWDFEGKIISSNQQAIDVIYSKLLDWQFNGTLLTYTGAIRSGNLIITDLNKTYDDGGFKDAVKISVSLLAVSTPTSSFVKAVHVGAVKPSGSSSGVYVTVRAGNTYWGWWQQYGTAIQTLRNWNKWPDRRIPIGARARVK